MATGFVAIICMRAADRRGFEVFVNRCTRMGKKFSNAMITALMFSIKSDRVNDETNRCWPAEPVAKRRKRWSAKITIKYSNITEISI